MVPIIPEKAGKNTQHNPLPRWVDNYNGVNCLNHLKYILRSAFPDLILHTFSTSSLHPDTLSFGGLSWAFHWAMGDGLRVREILEMERKMWRACAGTAKCVLLIARQPGSRMAELGQGKRLYLESQPAEKILKNHLKKVQNSFLF